MATTAKDDISLVMNVGFDMIMGPVMRYKKEFGAGTTVDLDYDQFAMAMYLAFKGGNDGGPRPQAIIYDGFSVVGVPKGMDLLCMFVSNTRALQDMARLKAFADEISTQMNLDSGDDGLEGSDPADAGENAEEIKRIVCNMLRKNELTTPDIRRNFDLTSSGIWAIMSALEHDGLVRRVGKSGKAVVWTLA